MASSIPMSVNPFDSLEMIDIKFESPMKEAKEKQDEKKQIYRHRPKSSNRKTFINRAKKNIEQFKKFIQPNINLSSKSFEFLISDPSNNSSHLIHYKHEIRKIILLFHLKKRKNESDYYGIEDVVNVLKQFEKVYQKELVSESECYGMYNFLKNNMDFGNLAM